MNLEIFDISIFPKDRVIAGVTKRNQKIFPETGLSLSPAEILSKDECDEHLKIFAGFLGKNVSQLKFVKQIHSNIVVSSNHKDINLIEADGIITDITNVIIFVKIADCCAILIYDPVHHVASAVHSGWRGTKLNIVKTAISKMMIQYGSKPSELLFYLSPTASGERYEVEYNVAQYFPESTKQINDKKFLFDNQNEIIKQILSCGAVEENIEVNKVCTINSLECHSYRRDKVNSGRMGAYICLI